jgi:hypothetical protein
MLFWGWGGGSVHRQLSPNQAVVLAYRYFHLMFFLTTTFGYRYQLATLSEHGWAHRPIMAEEARILL